MESIELVKDLNEKFTNLDAYDCISHCLDLFSNKMLFASSFGAEDQVITHMIAKTRKSATIITLDTGRVFPETYDLMHRTVNRYPIQIKSYYPSTEEVEEMVNTRGINLFYESIENRKLCCTVRKINPLKRALKGADAWMTGLRQDQSVTRAGMNIVEWDNSNSMIKINPLWNWTEAMVWNYIKEYDIPYNKLHDMGFPSIGCQPCTRAILPREDLRSGRWWWELPESKECGLHASKLK
jgi:phosphoadenosine phosphosulfate reductase